MQRFELVEVAGHIVGRLGVALFQVRLPNGHLVVAHLSPEVAPHFLKREGAPEAVSVLPNVVTVFGEKGASTENDVLIGTEVLIRLRAFDLSSGSIISLGSMGQGGGSSLEVARSVMDK